MRKNIFSAFSLTFFPLPLSQGKSFPVSSPRSPSLFLPKVTERGILKLIFYRSLGRVDA